MRPVTNVTPIRCAAPPNLYRRKPTVRLWTATMRSDRRRGTMSTQELGTIQGTKSSVGRTAGWILALVLAVLFAVSMIATAGPGESVERAPAAPAFTVGDQLAGGGVVVSGDGGHLRHRAGRGGIPTPAAKSKGGAAQRAGASASITSSARSMGESARVKFPSRKSSVRPASA
jgi:hypothetical protein